MPRPAREARAVGGDRARPRRLVGAEPHALAAPRLPRLLREHRLGARDRRRLARRRVQPERHPLADVAGPRPSSSRSWSGWLARDPRPPAPDGFDGQLADTASTRRSSRSPPRASRPFRDVREDRPRGRARRRRLLLRAGALLDRQGLRRPRLRDRGPAGRSRSTRRSGCGPDALERAIAEDRAAGWRPSPSSRRPGRRRVDVRRPAAGRRGVCERESSGSTSTRRTPARRRSLPEMRPLFAGWERATRSSSTRTSGCSCRSTAPRSSSAGWSAFGAPSRVVPELPRSPRGQAGARLHGLRRAARPALPRPEDVDDAARLRRRRE